MRANLVESLTYICAASERESKEIYGKSEKETNRCRHRRWNISCVYHEISLIALISCLYDCESHVESQNFSFFSFRLAALRIYAFSLEKHCVNSKQEQNWGKLLYIFFIDFHIARSPANRQTSHEILLIRTLTLDSPADGVCWRCSTWENSNRASLSREERRRCVDKVVQLGRM